jgi:isopenicillin N synthase-like dioxygenase
VPDLKVIDIEPLFDHRLSRRAAVDAAIGDAIEQQGAFVVAGYPQAERIDEWARTLLRFYDLPEAERRAVASVITDPAGPAVYRGWKSFLQPEAWAYNQMFDIGPRQPHPAPAVNGMHHFAEANSLPATEPCPGWFSAVDAYYDLMLDVGTRVMLAAGRWAGFDDHRIAEGFRTGNSTLRLLDYPPKPGGLAIDSEAAGVPGRPPLAASKHTDVAGLSLLWQREPGLQAQSSDRIWHDVPMLPNTVSVHLGTVLQLMTDGRVPATPHRVVDHGRHRQSVAFFVEPGLGTRLAPLDDGASVDPAGPGTYGWHLQERFSQMEGYRTIIPAPG